MLSSLNPIPSLPEFRGPYKVGSTEFEIPVEEIPSTTKAPDAQITTIKFRLYYPTGATSSKKTLYWLPSPQKQWTEAYASFMGASDRTSSIISSLPSLLNYAKIPAFPDAPLLDQPARSSYPLMVFSHGLGGNCQTYSSIVGSLASCGVICAAPEHRDGSAPTSIVKSTDGKTATTIPYQKLSHAPSTDVLNSRNAQLRIRSWELELVYSALKAMNDGKKFTNYADNSAIGFTLHEKLDMRPGKVSWSGHSFGAATITQFVKSVFYHKYLPLAKQGEEQGDWDWTPLYKVASSHDLVSQITAASPVALLDLWTMPLRGDTTKWLWERPMPCWTKSEEINVGSSKPNTVAIMSTEFYKWTDLLNRTRAVLSEKPVQAFQALVKKQTGVEDAPAIDDLPSLPPPEPTLQIPEITKEHAPYSADSSRSTSPALPSSPSSSQSSLLDRKTDSSSKSAAAPQLYLVPHSAHLSQSDFGPLFPNLVKYFMKALEPEKTIELNVRAMLAVMRGAGLRVENLTKEDDHILDGPHLAQEKRWVSIPLVNV